MSIFRLAGPGLHRGAPSEAWFERVSRRGLSVSVGSQEVVLGADVVGSAHGALATDLWVGRELLQTVEHWLSAAIGLGVGGVRLCCAGGELPGAGGSALRMARALADADLPALPTWTPPWPIEVRQGRAVARWWPGRGLEVWYRIDFAGSALGTQTIDVELTPARYMCDIAPARTFAVVGSRSAFLEARRGGVGAGLGPEDGFVAGSDGYLFGEPRWPDEAVRHKVLDLMGDLGLLGFRPGGRIEVEGGGHRLHRALARAAAALVQDDARRLGVPLREAG